MVAFLPLPFWRSWHLEAGEKESVISLIQIQSGVSGGVRGNATCCLPVRRNLVQGLLSLSSAFFFLPQITFNCTWLLISGTGHLLQMKRWLCRSQLIMQIPDMYKHFLVCFHHFRSPKIQWWIYGMRHLWLVRFYFSWQATQIKTVLGYHDRIAVKCHVRLSSAKFKCPLKRCSISPFKSNC